MVLLGRHFARVELLDRGHIGMCGFRCYLGVICRVKR